MLQGRGFDTRCGELIFPIYPILPAALDPWVYSASNRNKYQKQEQMNKRVELTTLPPSMSRFLRQCGILNISQPYRPARPDTGIALLYNRNAIVSKSI
jgi:hypothetical protein